MEAIPYLFQTSMLLLALSGGYYLLLRRETFFQANRLLLWLSLVGALWLPLVKLPDLRPEPIRYFGGIARRFQIRNHIIRDLKSRIAPSIEKIAPTPRQAPVMNLPPGNEPQVQIGEVELPTQSFSWTMILGIIYCSVAGFLLVRFLVQLRSLVKLIERSEHTDYEDFTLATNESVDSPFSFFRWVVLNPAQYTPDEQEQILRHERVHVRQWHSLDTLVAEVLCIVCWFNPGAWLFRRLVHQTLEYIADRAVLQEGVDARAYQYNLLKVTLSANYPTISSHFSKSELKNRIQMINRRRSGWRALWRYSSLLAVASSIAMLWQCQFTDNAIVIPTAMQSFVAKDGETIYWIVTPLMSDSALGELQKTLQSCQIAFKPDIVRSRRVRLIRLEANVVKYEANDVPPDSVLGGVNLPVSFHQKYGLKNHKFISAGSAVKPALLPTLGFWYNYETGFHSDLVTNDFPDALKRQADDDGFPSFMLDRITSEDARRIKAFDPRNGHEMSNVSLKELVGKLPKKLPEKYATMSLVELISMVSHKPSPNQQHYTMDMNRLLEVSFMKYRECMLRVTDDYHLDVLPEYRQAVITIDNKPATLAQLRAVHIRQVDWAYVRRKGELERVLDAHPYEAKYAISIRLAPRRAQRDSSYYVFSPFYSGDF